MTLVEVIQKLQKLDAFAGGNDKQRTHLNEIVNRINAMIDGANNDPQAQPTPQTNDQLWLAVDGIPTVYGIYLEGLPQP